MSDYKYDEELVEAVYRPSLNDLDRKVNWERCRIIRTTCTNTNWLDYKILYECGRLNLEGEPEE